MDITEFLLARIAEDEAAALEAASDRYVSGYVDGVKYDHPPPDGRRVWQWAEEGYKTGGTYWLREVGGSQHAIRTYSRDQAAYCVRFQPERVLAECEAKRQVVAGCREADVAYAGIRAAGLGSTQSWTLAGALETLRQVCRYLAMPYADHSDYQQEWKP